jgi:hypothetical protein
MRLDMKTASAHGALIRLFDLAAHYPLRYCVATFEFFFVLVPIFSFILYALPIATSPIIGSVVLDPAFSALAGIFFCTILAFIKMPIRHHFVLIKIINRKF